MSLLDKVNNLNKTDFISIFGNVFEKTDWVAKKAYSLKPFISLDDLFSKIINIFENSKKEDHLEIFNAHPDLVVAKKLTNDSKKEQNNAQLNQCTEKEMKEFTKLNIIYKKKFNFPFIIAVSGKNKFEILKNFRERIKNDKIVEFKEAKNQVKKIASIRIQQIIKSK
jgi:OHCU decarboxylase